MITQTATNSLQTSIINLKKSNAFFRGFVFSFPPAILTTI